MPNCKDCIYFPICDRESALRVGGCELFKDKDKFIESPCKLGDRLYKITKRGQIEEGVASGIFYGQEFHIVNWKSPKINTGIPFHRFGRSVFLTREEAERALKNE